jgi:hypothetical protein
MKSMGTGFEKTYSPDNGRRLIYEKRYEQYKILGNQIEKSTFQHP